MKSTLTAISILMLLFFSAEAQNKAEVILTQFSENMQMKETIIAEFEYLVENNNNGLKDGHKGILYVKGEKFRLQIADQIIMSDGTSLWTYIPDVEEVQLNSIEHSEELLTPTKLFSSYNENYHATYNKEYSVGPKTIHVIDLEPKDKSQGFTSAQMELDKSTLELIQFSVFDNHNNKFSYIVNKFFSGRNLEDSIFIFDASKHPDVEVIDMQ